MVLIIFRVTKELTLYIVHSKITEHIINKHTCILIQKKNKNCYKHYFLGPFDTVFNTNKYFVKRHIHCFK